LAQCTVLVSPLSSMYCLYGCRMVTELQEAFMLFDYSKSGMIYARDIGPVVRSIGLKPSQAEIQSIMAEVQQSGMYLYMVWMQTFIAAILYIIMASVILYASAGVIRLSVI